MNDGRIIIPGRPDGGEIIKPTVETASAPIGGMQLEYYVQPGVSATVPLPPTAAKHEQVMAGLASANNMCINALIREVVMLRSAVQEMAQSLVDLAQGMEEGKGET